MPEERMREELEDQVEMLRSGIAGVREERHGRPPGPVSDELQRTEALATARYRELEEQRRRAAGEPATMSPER